MKLIEMWRQIVGCPVKRFTRAETSRSRLQHLAGYIFHGACNSGPIK
jgi:hypothetical protein